MDELSLRPAAPEDLPRLTEIYNHYVLNTPITFDLVPFTLETRRPWFQQFGSSGRHRLLVAERASTIVAYAGSHSFRAKQAYETTAEVTIYCAPDATGCGIGHTLYQALFAELRGQDIHSFIAGVTLPNAASVALHERFGFSLTGVMHGVGRKFGQYWDVGWWERVVG